MLIEDKSRREHPIERLMDNAFSKLKGLVSSDTVVGAPIRTADGVSIVPITKVTMGFLTGGGEYSDLSRECAGDYPFAGGSGAGVSVSPVGFLVSDGKSIKMVGIDDKNAYDRLFDLIPELVKSLFGADKACETPDKTTEKVKKEFKK
ncbi:MAG: GerW family sporulation protein [Clostridiales bacterium]|jgi:sporulation protein YtfJ|nr:GerW family sporulation protein [Clostridiales bacterium]